MKTVWATELGYSQSEFPEFYILLTEQTCTRDNYGSFIITGSKSDSDLAKEISSAANAFVENHEMLAAVDFIPLALFSDYGFQTTASTYLFKQGLACFRFASGGKKEREMALMEMNEILIASCEGHGEIYFFIDGFQKDLVLGLSKAYDIEVSFLNLDKY